MRLRQDSEAIEVIRFPDGQPHIRLRNPDQLPDDVDVTWRIRNPEELYLLACLRSALSWEGIGLGELTIPYLMAARSDRVMMSGDAYGLLVVADVLNRLDFVGISVLDPHSAQTIRLLPNAVRIEPDFLLAGLRADVLVLPDNGSHTHAEHRLELLGARGLVTCTKARDLSTGRITLTVGNPEVAVGKDVVIVDDVCDGGATFTEIARQLPGVRSLTLVVTHGIFSKGFGDLAPAFHRIICSDSYASSYPNQPQNLTIVPCNL